MNIIGNDRGRPVPAVITRQIRRRGRPKLSRPSKDTGTPELVMKRLMGETAEALDLCLERGLVTNEQHWCGIHLRWLYTLRYGIPGVKAVDTTHLGGIDTKYDDQQWRMAREDEFREAIQKLHECGLVADIVNLCIYNERPKFLSLHVPVTTERAQAVMDNIQRIREGLDVLMKHWQR